jgi:hypothetical protein
MRRVAVMGFGVVVAALATGLVLWGLQSRAPRGERRYPSRAA